MPKPQSDENKTMVNHIKISSKNVHYIHIRWSLVLYKSFAWLIILPFNSWRIIWLQNCVSIYCGLHENFTQKLFLQKLPPSWSHRRFVNKWEKTEYDPTMDQLSLGWYDCSEGSIQKIIIFLDIETSTCLFYIWTRKLILIFIDMNLKTIFG